MDPEFWHERWARDEIGFHQDQINSHLQSFFQRLGLAAGAHVLVPLCGKSRDMLWLADRGCRVTGIEINRRAVGDFFLENRLTPDVQSHRGAASYRNGSIEIWLADFFRIDTARLAAVDAVYDRAALVAMPRNMRAAYAGRLSSVIPAGAPLLLVTLDYAEDEMDGPPFPVPAQELPGLFGAEFDIQQLHSESCIEREPRFREKGVSRMLEQVHVLRKRGRMTGA
jgi:thiopurine S-methyltransferase